MVAKGVLGVSSKKLTLIRRSNQGGAWLSISPADSAPLTARVDLERLSKSPPQDLLLGSPGTLPQSVGQMDAPRYRSVNGANT